MCGVSARRVMEKLYKEITTFISTPDPAVSFHSLLEHQHNSLVYLSPTPIAGHRCS